MSQIVQLIEYYEKLLRTTTGEIEALLPLFAAEVTDLQVGDLIRDPWVRGWAEIVEIRAIRRAILDDGPTIEIVIIGKPTTNACDLYFGKTVDWDGDSFFGLVRWCTDYTHASMVRRYTDLSKVPQRPKRKPKDEARIRKLVPAAFRREARAGVYYAG